MKTAKTLKTTIIILVSAVAMAIPFLVQAYPYLTALSLVAAIIMFVKAKTNFSAAIMGYIFGFIFFLLQTSWIISLTKFAGGWAYAGWLALTLFQALAFLFFAIGLRVIHRKINNWVGVSVATALFFVSIEIIRAINLIAYPWGQLSIPFVDAYPLYKFAVLAGWPGLTFIVALTSSLIAFYFLKKPAIRQLSVVVLIMLTFLVAISFVNTNPEGSSVKAAVIQTNIDMTDKMAGSIEKLRFDTLQDLVKKVSKGTQIAIGPESAIPGFYPLNSASYDLLSKSTEAKLIIGSLREKNGFTYNSVIGLGNYYDKNKLLLFGEYIPFDFLKRLIKPLNESLAAGEKAKPLGRLALLICSESGDSLYARNIVNKGAQIIAVSSNDAWFAGSSAPAQHLQNTRLRAIENGRYLLMSANYGYSAIVGPDGKIIKKTRLGEEKVLNENVKMIKAKTFYTKYGFWTTLLLLAGGLVSVIYALVARRS